MTFIKNFALFWYDFIVGDDWMIAVEVIAAVLASAWSTNHAVNAWWLLPLIVVVMLTFSLLREVRNRK